MIQIAMNGLLDTGLVDYHAIFVQLVGGQKNGDCPVMAVQTATLAVVRQR